MGGTLRRINRLGLQLEQAYAEGILNHTVLSQILDSLQLLAECAIYREHQKQLEEWCWDTGWLVKIKYEMNCRQGFEPFNTSLDEEILYQEYIRSLPDGL